MRPKKTARSHRPKPPASSVAPRDNPAGPTAARAFPIVGIGASAGGLEAMTQLLKPLSAHTGMAFVLVQHLDPTHESALTSLLSRLTEIPVAEAKNNMRLRPNHLYVIPPNKLMGISRRRLRLSPRRAAEPSLSIDHFFRTLAEEEGSRAIGVILSGNGSDGTQGLLAIKSAGGITFAQEEKSAKYPAMPGSAITAGCVDFVMAPERIARELARVAGHPYIGPGTVEADRERPRPTEERAFEEILTTLRQRTAVDFTHYKHATLQRRMQRRMLLHKFESLKEYAVYLRGHPAEVKELFNDILIHVTGFFRDPGVFHTLKKKLLPRIVKNKPPDEPLRLWIPGCSTGEEVYSIAIVVSEFLSERRLHHPVQIFGTDIHETALGKARAALYPEAIRADVSGERLRRFFVKTEGCYRVNKSVRELCIFARQNMVVDPPFSNLDLISCRNVLIYLGQPLQRKVIPLFHYALRPNGLLLLGVSETVGSFADLFALIDNKAKIYFKKGVHVRPTIAFGAGSLEPHAPPVAERAAPVPVGPTLGDVQKQADRILLTHYSPAGVIINKHLEVLQFRGRTGPYLEHAQGEASLNLLKMVREGLVIDVRGTVSKAIKQDIRVRQPGVRFKQNGHSSRVSLEVVPYSVPPSRERFYLVLFEPETESVENGAAPAARRGRGRGLAATEGLEQGRLREELAATRESLQAIIEEQEATMEELRSANEEILSSNEELQSTNEELETAKEELQSTNEELTTLNDELESRNNELEHVNNDLHNVLGCVNIPILILDSDLRIRRFTGVAERMFNLIPADIGRPITDINLPLDIPHLSTLVLDVIDNLTIKELEVRDRHNHWWSARIRPYKTTDSKIDGAVVVLVDIDLIKASAEQLAQNRAFTEAVLNTIRDPALLLDKDLAVRAANQAFYHAFGVGAGDTLGRPVYQLGNNQWDIPRLRTLLEEILPQNTKLEDFEVEHNFPGLGRKKMKLNAHRILVRGDQQHLILLSIQDVTDPEPK